METVTGFQRETQARGNWVFLLHVRINRTSCRNEHRRTLISKIFYSDLAVLLRFDHEQQFTVFNNYNILQK